MSTPFMFPLRKTALKVPKTLTTCTKECRALTFINWIRNSAMSHRKANISKHFCSNAKPSIYYSTFIWEVYNISVTSFPSGFVSL